MIKANQQPSHLRFGVFELDLSSGELRKGGTRVRLQEKPFQILVALIERPGQVVTKEELKARIWPDTVVELDLALSAAVTKIRRALGDSADSPRFIETLPRRGYRFLQPSEIQRASVQSIAVLPFQDLSVTQDKEYFSDGLTDVLITELAKIGALKVISRTSVMLYKGVNKSAPVIGRELGVATLVEGSVQGDAENVRVNVQLIDAANDNHIWADTYDQALTAVLALQRKVARDVAAKIHVNLTPNELGRLRSSTLVDASAFDAYLRGKHEAAKMTPDGLRTALAYFQTSLESDPHSSLAHSGLSTVFFLSGLLVLMHPQEAGRRGYEEALRAVELDEMSPHGHTCQGLQEQFFRWNWQSSEACYRRAIALSPNDAEARIFYGMLMTCLGRVEEGRRSVEQALELDPLNLMNHHLAGVNSMWSAQYEDALKRLRGVVARAPSMQMSQLTIWCALNALERYEEAYEAAIQSWACTGDEQMVQALRDGYAEAGYAGAMRHGGDTLAARFVHTYVPIYITAMHYDFGGEVEKALDWMERGYEERDHAMSYIHRKPYSDRLFEHPRYSALFKRLNLPESSLLPVWRTAGLGHGNS